MIKSVSAKIIVIIVIAAFVVPQFATEPVNAATTPLQNSTIRFTGCAVGAALAPWLKEQLDNKLYQLFNQLPASLIDKLNLGGLLGILTGGGSPTFAPGTVPVNDAYFQQAYVQYYRQLGIQRCFTREILNGVIKGVLDTARTGGRNGGVTWVKNWRNFQTDAQYRGEDIFRGILADSNLCGYFGNDLKKIFGANQAIPLNTINTRTGDLDSFQVKSNCTLPNNFNQAAYKNDFNGNGGWDAWSRIVEPQNNVYGSYFLALDEANKQRDLEQSTDLNNVLANRGNPGIFGQGAADSCQVKTANGRCVLYKDIKTPGSIVDQTTANALAQDLQWITNTDNIAGVIENITDTLLGRLANLGDSSKDQYTVYSQPPISEPTTPGGTTVACTDTGQAEQDFMLPLLNGGTAPQDVADQTNQKFSLTTGNQAVYYGANNTIGLPEFYAAGPIFSRPVSPVTGQPWDIVSRCTPSGGSGGNGGGGTNEGGTKNPGF